MAGYESLLVIQVILLMVQTGVFISLAILIYKLGNLLIGLLIKEFYKDEDK